MKTIQMGNLGPKKDHVYIDNSWLGYLYKLVIILVLLYIIFARKMKQKNPVKFYLMLKQTIVFVFIIIFVFEALFTA